MTNAPYVVILDNNVVDEPLIPGLPYWTFDASGLPTRETAMAFVEDVLFQSELWANEGGAEDWISLRLLACCSMCSRCGHLMAGMVGAPASRFHVTWYVAENAEAHLLSGEAFVNTGRWYDSYVGHRCTANFFDLDVV